MRLFFTVMIFVATTYIVGCSSDSDIQDSEPETHPEKEIEEPIPTPSAAQLIFPLDNTECIEGEIENDQFSKVKFEWSTSENTDSYNLGIRNLKTNRTTQEKTTENSLIISISRGTPYEWYVISTAEGTNETSLSERWQFYNAGSGEVLYAPNPAKLVYPEDKSIKVYSQDDTRLRWKGYDLDGDILEYEVYFGIENQPTVPIAVISDTIYERMLNKEDIGKTFYWKIRTIDSHGNSSMSQINSFTYFLN